MTGKPTTRDDLMQQLAKLFHDVYEDAAARHGWSTQEQSRVQFKDLPRANREAMLDAVDAVLAAGEVVPTSDVLKKLSDWEHRLPARFVRELRALTRQEPR